MLDAMSLSGKTASSAASVFLIEANQVLDQLRAAAQAFVENAPQPIRRAADLHRALDVDPPLGWQFFRVAIAVDPFAALPYVPRSGSMQKILRQARTRGWNPDVLSRLDDAFEKFEEFVQRTAGTRGNFDANIASLESGASSQIQNAHRTAAFRANSRVWGVRVRTDYRGVIFKAGDKPGTLHAGLIHGRIDLESSRHSGVLALRRGTIYDRGGAPVSTLGQTRVMTEFCSKPCPAVQTVVGVDGACEVLRLDQLAAKTPTTFFGSQIHLNWGDGDSQQDMWGVKALSTVPAEVLLIDLILPRSWIDPATLRVSTHGNLADVHSVYVDSEVFTLPANEGFERLGSNLQALRTADVPRCPELVTSLVNEQNWDLQDIEIIRCRVRYPILHSLIWLRASVPN